MMGTGGGGSRSSAHVRCLETGTFCLVASTYARAENNVRVALHVGTNDNDNKLHVALMAGAFSGVLLVLGNHNRHSDNLVQECSSGAGVNGMRECQTWKASD